MFNSQFQNPNNNINPNFDHHQDQINDPLYYRIANYLMSDDDDEKSFSLKNNYVSENTTDYFDGSSDSVSLARNIKCRRDLKKYKTEEELIRFAFRTKTDLEIMDDGYKWRKYGKKMVKNNPNPRNYFKCSNGGCSVKKRVERDSEDPSYVITTYQGLHNHT